MTYRSINVRVNGNPYTGIVVKNVTYIPISSLFPIGDSVNSDGDGKFTVIGRKVQGVSQNGIWYIPWSSDPAIHATPDKKGGWIFVKAKATPAPTPSPSSGDSSGSTTKPTPPQTYTPPKIGDLFGDKTVIAVIKGRVVNDSFCFSLDAPNENGIGNLILDTGAFELTIAKGIADAMTPPLTNLGNIVIGGIGGSETAYRSQYSFILGETTYTDVPCIVDPNFTAADSLFGFSFLEQNNLSISLDIPNATLLILK